MSLDNLTIAAIAIVIVVILVVIIVSRNNSTNDAKMRQLARHMALLHTDEQARELCHKIKDINPDLCAGIDFTMKKEGDDIVVDEWNSHHPRP